VWAGTGFLGILLAGAFVVWQPANDPASSWCVFYRLTHIPCPGCGLTRAMAALFHGDWRASFRYHPLALPILLQVAGGWAFWGLRLGRPDSGLGSTDPQAVLGRLTFANLAALVLVWLIRAATGSLPF
jgi:hypothetical protein